MAGDVAHVFGGTVVIGPRQGEHVGGGGVDVTLSEPVDEAAGEIALLLLVLDSGDPLLGLVGIVAGPTGENGGHGPLPGAALLLLGEGHRSRAIDPAPGIVEEAEFLSPVPAGARSFLQGADRRLGILGGEGLDQQGEATLAFDGIGLGQDRGHGFLHPAGREGLPAGIFPGDTGTGAGPPGAGASHGRTWARFVGGPTAGGTFGR